MELPLVIAPTFMQMLLIPLMLSVGSIILWNKLKKPALLIMFIGFLISFISVIVNITLLRYIDNFELVKFLAYMSDVAVCISAVAFLLFTIQFKKSS